MITPDQVAPNPFGHAVLVGPDDYLPEWDVESIARRATDRLLEAIEDARGHVRVDPNRRIQVLLGPPGYGKTHLFGRIARKLRAGALFVFVPQIEDVSRPLGHVGHHVVRSVFKRPTDGHSPVEAALARLCRPSFLALVSALPRPLATEYAGLRGRLEAGDDAVWDIIGRREALQPFQALGNSLAAAFPDLDANVVRALALGWAPAHERDLAERWLRGESLLEDQARRLGLPDEPPGPVDVIKTVAALVAGPAPMVLCLDQLDVLLTEKETAPLHFSNAMMLLRGSIPNLLLVLGCLQVDWTVMAADKFSRAFRDRTAEAQVLDLLTEPEASELIHRRLQHWPGGPEGRESWWPIDVGSFRRLMADPQTPRGIINWCEQRYQEWADDGDLSRLVDLMPEDRNGPVDEVILFRREWDKVMEAVDASRVLEDVQDQRLFRAFREGLGLLATQPRVDHRDIVPEAIHDNPIPQVIGNTKYARYSFEVVLRGRKGAESVIIALESNHNAHSFHPYFQKAKETCQGRAVGLSFVTARPRFPAGANAAAAMDAETRAGHLRPVTLTDYREDYRRLECYLTLLDRASTSNLLLGTRTVTVGECRALAAKAGVLADLGLFDRMLGGWVYPPGEAVAASAPAAVAAPPKATAARPRAAAGPPPPGPAPTKTLRPEPEPRKAAEPGPIQAAEPEPEPAPAAVAVAPGPDESLAEERLEWAATCQGVIVKRLGELGARVRTAGATQIGPTFARFLVTPYPATTINKVRKHAEDLKVGLAGVDALPLVDSQGGAISIDVQLPARFRRTIRLGDVGPMPAGLAAAFPVGQDVEGVTRWLDFADANTCHLLVAGTTGSGKSEFLKAMIAALAGRLGPGGVKFGLVDPKRVTFNFGDRAGPFLLRPVVHTADDALELVKACFDEAERRYDGLRRRKLEDLAGWQAVDPKAPPRHVLIFDEFADLMADKDAKKELEAPLKRLGAKARAAGIHLVLATQRPEATVVTPLLRSNLPARIGLKVASPADSRIILAKPDAADLLGRGDLLWERGAGLIRLQSPIVDREELEAILFPG